MRLIASMLLAATSLVSVAAHAAEANAASTADAADTDASLANAIVVVGKGETRQAQQLSAKDIAVMAPGTSPMKAIENLPSVNFESADPFGAYEWAERVSIRGFAQNQLGFTLDGVPLGDASYSNDNGLHVSRAISSEDIAVTRVSQGAGALGTQATNNLGGTIEFASLDPVDHFALDANATYGSFNTSRFFVRANMGVKDGIRGYVSYSYYNTDKWKGTGRQRQHDVTAKVIAPIGTKTEVTAYFNYSDRKENDYQDLSLGMINRLGYNWDNIANYALAVQVAKAYQNYAYYGGSTPSYPSPIKTVDDEYYDAAGLRKDYLGYIGVKSQIASNVKVEAKAYYHQNDGAGIWWTPYIVSAFTPNNTVVSIRTTEYGIRRGGLFGNVQADLGRHHLTVGGWYESNTFRQARRFYATASDTDPGYGLLDMPSNPFYTQWQFNYGTDTIQYYVEDNFHIGDAITVSAGWKGFQVTERANPVVNDTTYAAYLGGALASGRISSTDWFQPHAGVVYKLSQHGEAFGSFSRSTRAFVAAGTGASPFATTQAGFSQIASSLKPEQSDTYELGYRYADGRINATLGGYWVNFRNRIASLSSGADIVGSPTILENVGSVRSVGLEALVNAKLARFVTGTVSYAYNNSTYRDNMVKADGTLYAATAGKTVADAPHHMARFELAYDDSRLFGRVSVNYMSERAVTYTNDVWVDGHTLTDLTVGYRVQNRFTPKPIELQLNITNLTDEKYVSTIGTNGIAASGDTATLMVGSPRAFFGTVKVGF